MTRLLDFHQSEESVLVSRILLQVHKAIDSNFPNTRQPSRKFAKTLFSETDEPTHNKVLPNTDIRPSQHGTPVGTPTHLVPPPPSVPTPQNRASSTQGTPASRTGAPPQSHHDGKTQQPSRTSDHVPHTDEISTLKGRPTTKTAASRLSTHGTHSSTYRQLEKANKQRRLLIVVFVALFMAMLYRFHNDLFLIWENLAHK